MQQKSQVDTQFLQGLEMLIDSISKSEDVIIKDDADHWCPDVQEWHTADHEPANPPSVHVNVDNSNGDDPYQSENGDVEKGWGAVAGKVAGSLAREAGRGAGEGAVDATANRLTGKSKEVSKQSTVGNENLGGGDSFAAKGGSEGMVVMADDDSEIPPFRPSPPAPPTSTRPTSDGPTTTTKEYDQKTNLPSVEQEGGEDSVAQPFLRRREVRKDDTHDIGEIEIEGLESQLTDEEADWEPPAPTAAPEPTTPKPATATEKPKSTASKVLGGVGAALKPVGTAVKPLVDFAGNYATGGLVPSVTSTAAQFKPQKPKKVGVTAPKSTTPKPKSTSTPEPTKLTPEPTGAPPAPGGAGGSGGGGIPKSHHDEIKKSYEQSIDMLKIWASVDRELIKDDPTDLVDDLNILNSFDLGININAEDLVDGTIVHKMLVDRASRPTKEWWEASLNLAKSIENVEEPAFLAAYLYYDSDEFDLADFISIQKTGEVDQRSEYGKPQDLEMPENSSGGDGMAGLGLASENELDNGPDDDEDCD